MDFVQACRQFIAAESTPASGCQAIAQLAAELCKEQKLEVELQEEHVGEQKQFNIIARPQPRGDLREFMLQTHLDTPDPGHYALWTKTGQNPFDAHIIDNKIYGLGAVDVKLDFLCKLRALASFTGTKNWKRLPVLVGTFGEETGMGGAMKLIRKNKISADMALVGEPSDLLVINAAKGFAGVEIRIPFEAEELRYRQEHNLMENASTQSKAFNGKSAHSSVPQQGESAINKMFEYLLMLPEDITIMDINGGVNINTVAGQAYVEFDLGSAAKNPMSKKLNRIYLSIKHLEEEFIQFEDMEFTPPHPTLNIGLIKTNEDHVSISGTCRMPPLIRQEVYERWMKDLSAACQQANAEFRVTDYKRPYRTSRESKLLQGCIEELKSMGLSDRLITRASTNEASLFTRVGIECVSFGAGKLEGNAHTPEEHVAIADLEKATEFYRRMIQRFCL